jgi:hypothetical protein
MEMASESTLRQFAQQAANRTNLEELAAKTLSLQIADKFRLAAMLLDQNIPQLAETIARRAVQELELARLLAR